MAEEERWILHGTSPDDPQCIRSAEQLEEYVQEVGFLPLFRNGIPGFSVEEHTLAADWWGEDESRDPWEWRKALAAGGKVAYGKFFDRKAGFISKEWFPAFANYRRDGYDFDARWDDELAGIRSKKIMDLFAEEHEDRELFSFEVRRMAGFGKTGEKNFEGEVTQLQMQTYLCVRDFRRRKNRDGNEYGWGIAVYCTPEHLWGNDFVTGLYREDPKESLLRIALKVREEYPEAEERDILKVLGYRESVPREEKKTLPYPDNLVKAMKIEGLSAQNMTADQLAGLEVALGQLREKQQRVMRMKYREHLKNEEIGRRMNRAAGTVGTYHTKAMGKLKWPRIAAWYLDGYQKTLRAYLKKRNLTGDVPQKTIDDAPAVGSPRGFEQEYCLKIGLDLKQFDALMRAGICTVGDLLAVQQDPGWYRAVKGIGPRGAADIAMKLEQFEGWNE